MSRASPADLRRIISADLREVYDRCAFRSILGIAPPSLTDPLESLLPRIAHAIAVFGSDPKPISPATMAELVTSIRAGGSVLLMSDRADCRDYARREILAMVELENDGTRRAAANRGRSIERHR